MKKNKKIKQKLKIFFLINLISLFFIIGCSGSNEAKQSNAISAQNGDLQNFPTKATGSLEQGDALIELAPKYSGNGKLIVEISANTHSVDLGQFDLMKLTTLEYGNNEVKPISAPKLSGHHASGVLEFSIEEQPSNFKVVIKNIPLIERRVFEWP